MQKLLILLSVLLLPSAFVYAGGRPDELDLDGFVFHGVALPKARAGLAPLRQGTVQSVDVTEGTAVEAGTLLVSMDSRVQEAAVALAEAAAARTGDVDGANAQLELAESRLGRLQASRRREPRSVTDAQLADAAAEVRTARATLATAREDLAAARATLALERARLEELRLRAPFDGLVTRIRTRVGESIAPGTAAVEVVDLSTLVAEVHLPAHLYGRVAVGQRIQLDASTPVSDVVEAELVWVDPVMDGATRSYRCVFEIDNADGRLPAGFTVEPRL